VPQGQYGSGDDKSPPIRSQFFYSSVIPIDDPLCTHAIAGGGDSRPAKSQLRPFSVGDNNALCNAWASCISVEDRQEHQQARKRKSVEVSPIKGREKLTRLVQNVALKHSQQHELNAKSITKALDSRPMQGTPAPVCCPSLLADVNDELESTFCALVRKRHPSLSTENVAQEVMMEIRNLRIGSDTSEGGAIVDGQQDEMVLSRPRISLPPIGTSADPIERHISSETVGSENQPIPLKQTQDEGKTGTSPCVRSGFQLNGKTTSSGSSSILAGLSRPPPLDDGISGKPFVRVGSPSLSEHKMVAKALSAAKGKSVRGPEGEASLPEVKIHSDGQGMRDRPLSAASTSHTRGSVNVVVGAARLHMVSIPELIMKPIYWSPVNDIAPVMRATWFYR
jgi:hypothetical protein